MDPSMFPTGLYFLVVGLAVIAVAWLAAQAASRRRQGNATSVEALISVRLASVNDAVVVVRAGGQVVFANEHAQRWFGLDGGEPDLWLMAQRVDPPEAFLELFATEGQASLALSGHNVEATSHRVAVGDQEQFIVVFREETPLPILGREERGSEQAMLVIGEISSAINASLDLDATLDAILGNIRRVIDYDAAQICLWEQETESLHPVARAGHDPFVERLRIEETAPHKLGQGYTGWVARNRQPLLIGDVGQRDDLQGKLWHPDDPSIRSYLGVPLSVRNRFIGTLELISFSRGWFDREDLGMLRLIAEQAAIAIENARQYGEQAERIAELSGLQKIAQAISVLQDPHQLYTQLGQRIADLMDVEIAGVLLYDEEHEGLIPQRPHHGVPDSVLVHYRISMEPGSPARAFWDEVDFWFSNRVSEDHLIRELGLVELAQEAGIRATALATMHVGDERIGALQVSNKRDGTGFNLNDIRLLQIYAEQAAIVVGNARLYSEEQSRVAELEGLQRIAQSMTAFTNPDELYAQLTARIAELMQVEICGVLIYDPDHEALIPQTPFFGVDDDVAHTFVTPVPAGSRSYRLWQESELFVSNDVVVDDEIDSLKLRRAALAAGIRNLVLAPLSAGGRRFGALHVANKFDGTDFDEDDERVLGIFAGQAAALIENARLYQDTDATLRSRIAELRSVSRISHELNATLELERILDVIATEAARAEGVRCGGVVMFVTDEEHSRFTPMMRFGCPPGGSSLTSIEEASARSGKPLMVEDFEQDNRYSRPHEGIRSALVVPIHFEGETVGLIQLHSDRPRALGPSVAEFVQALSSQASIAVGNATRHAEQVERGELLRQRADQLTQIFEVGRMFRSDQSLEAGLAAIARAVRESAGFNIVLISILTLEGAHLRRVAQAGLSPEAFQEMASAVNPWETVERYMRDEFMIRSSYFIPHAYYEEISQVLDVRRTMGTFDAIAPGQWHPDDLMIVPLRSSSGEILGILSVDDPQDGAVPTQSTVELLEIFGNQAALVIENSRLYQSVEDRAEELSHSLRDLERSYEKLDRLSREMIRKDMELSHANELLDLRARRLLALHRVMESLDTTQPPSDVLCDIAGAVVEEMDVDQCVIALERPDGKLDVIAAAGHLPEGIDLLGKISRNKRLMEAYLGGEAIILDGRTDQKRRRKSALQSAMGADSLLMMPLSMSGNERGMLVVGSTHPGMGFSEDDRDLFSLLASQVVVEHENARLYQTVQDEAAKATRERDRLQQLHVITTALQQTRDLETRLRVIARGVRLVGWQRSAVALFDEELAISHLVTADPNPDEEKRIRQELDQYKPHTLMFDPAFASQRVGTGFFIPDPEAPDVVTWQPGDLLYLPMYAGLRVTGLICLGNPADGLRPTDESLRPLELFAQQASSALENARLYQETLALQGYNEAIVQSIQQGIVVLDARGAVESFNQFMRMQYNWDDSAIGQNLFEIEPQLRDLGLAEALETVLANAEPAERTNLDYRLQDSPIRTLTLNIYVYPRYDEEQNVTGAVCLIEDVTQRIQLEADIALRGQQLAVLSEVSRAITATLSVDEVVSAVLNQAQKIVIHDRVTLWLRDPRSESLTLAGARGYEDDSAMLGLRVDIADSELFTELARTREPLLIDDTRADERFPSQEPYPMRTWLGAPLVSGRLVLGVLTLEKAEPNFYAPADAQVAQGFANQAAIALENARLFEEAAERAAMLHSQAERLALLNRISSGLASSLDTTGILQSAVDDMAEALEVDQCGVFMFDLDAGIGRLIVEHPSRVDGSVADLTIPTQDNPAVERIQEMHAPLAIEDASHDPLLAAMGEVVQQRQIQSMLLLPLTLGGVLIGLITLDATKRRRRFDQEQIELAQTITNQAAVAVQNARLFQETVERQRELEIVFQAGQIASASLDLETVVRNAADYFIQALRVDECTIALWERETEELMTLIVHPLEETPVDTEKGSGRFPAAEIPGAAHLIHKREPVLFSLSGDETDKGQAAWLRAEGLHSALFIPLVARDATIGLLMLGRTTPESGFSARDQRLAQALANTLATAMENARLHDETQERVVELTTINEIGRAITQTIAAEDLYRALEQQLRTVVGARSITLALYHAETQQLLFPLVVRNGLRIHVDPIPYGTDIYSHIVEAGEPLLLRRDIALRTLELGVEQVERGLSSFLGVPLFSAERSIGALAVEDYERENAFTEADLRVVGTIAAQVAVAIENTRLYAELEQRLSETTTLQEVSRVVNSALDLKEIFERVVTELASAFGYPMVGIFSLEDTTLRLEAHHGYGPEVVERYSTIPADKGIVGRAVRTGTPQLVEDVSKDPDYLVTATDTVSEVAIPIISDETALGVLDVQAGIDNPLDDKDLQLLRTFAGQVATAMHNASLYTQMLELSEELERRVEERTRELQEERDRIDTLFRITSELSASLDLDRVLNRALELVGEAVGAEHGSLFLIDPQSDRLIYRAAMSDSEILPPGGRQIALTRHEGMAGWVMDHREAVIVGNVQLDPRWADVPGTENRRSLLGAPLVANEEVLGCIFFASDSADAFNEGHLQLVEAAANQVATSINNAELYRMIRDQAERLGGMLRSQQTEAAKSQAILEGIADGVMVSDAAGEIILFNAAAERILELRRDEVLGRPSSDLTGLYGAGAQKWTEALTRWTEAPSSYQGDFLTEQLEIGDKVVSIHVSPVLHGSEFLGLVSVFRDITREVEADRIKSEFVANVSHELRTPMTSIKGYADLLLLGAAGDLTPDQRRFLEIVKSNADRLSMLVNDLLDISRIEQGRVDLDIRPVDIREVINDVLAMIEGHREEEGRDVSVSSEMPDELLMLAGDYDRITQILTNLVNNAYRYTPEGGTVVVRVMEETREDENGELTPGIRIDVSDTGIGIGADEQERIFERFYRGEDPLVMQSAGTGLGLSIVQHLTAMHNGLVWFESERGVGTTFSIWLPLKRQTKQ